MLMLRRPDRPLPNGGRTVILSFPDVVASYAMTITRYNYRIFAETALPDVLWAILDLLRHFPDEVYSVRMHGYDIEWDLDSAVSQEREESMVNLVRMQTGASDIEWFPRPRKPIILPDAEPTPTKPTSTA